MQTNCKICNRVSEFDDALAGKMVPCPICGNLFVITDSSAVEIPCPGCGRPVAPGCRICVHCGHSFDTGRKVEKHIPVYGEDFPPWKKALDATVDFIPGLFKPLTVALFILSVILAALINYFGLIILGLGAIFTCIFFAICSLFVYAHGVGFLMTGEVQLLQNAMAELTGRRWSFFLFLVFAPPVTIFLIIIKIGLILAKA